MDFIKYLCLQVSQKLSGPVWILGHLHFSINHKFHESWHILLGSLLMTLLVLIGIWLDYTQQKVKR